MRQRKITHSYTLTGALTGLALAALCAGALPAVHAQQGTPVTSRRIATGTAVKVTLLQKLDSGTAQVGDTVQVRVAPDDASGLPVGTVLQGRVTEARAATNRNPGTVAIVFTTRQQNSYRPSSAPTGDADQETTGATGATGIPLGLRDTVAANDTFLDEASTRLVGKTSASEKSHYTTIGAGAGALLGYARKRKFGDAVSGAVLGGAGGYAADQAQKHPAGDVVLSKGAAMTLKLDTPLIVRTEIIAPY